MRKARWAVLILAGTAALAVLAAGRPGDTVAYHLVKKVPIPGDENSWDYLSVEPATHRVFISRSTHVIVVDDEGNKVGDIPNTLGVHGTAFAPEFGRGFISDGGANSLTIFDLKTLQTISQLKLPAAQLPDGILYDPVSKRVFTFNARSGDATAVDAKAGEVAGTVPLGGKPEAAQTDGSGRVYVNIEDKHQIVEFDSKALKVLNTWPLDNCEEPTGLAIDITHKRLFTGCHSGSMLVVDYENGKVVASVPIGQGVDANAFDPTTDLAFASCGDGTITVAHQDSADKYTVVQTITTQRGARTMALDAKTHNIYTVTSDFSPPAAATAENPRPRPTPIPNTFVLMIFGR